jgi:type II secretory pathway component GspD/PulD (secretin)
MASSIILFIVFIDFAYASVTFDGITFSQFSQIYFSQFHSSYFICDDVLKEQRYLSIRVPDEEISIELYDSIANHFGYTVSEKSGVYHVCKSKQADNNVSESYFLYKTKHIDSASLVSSLSAIFPGSFSVMKSVSQNPDSVGSPENSKPVYSSSKYFIYRGSGSDIKKIKEMVSAIDVPQDVFQVNAAIYEYTTTEKDGSAVSFMSKIFKDRLGVSLTSDTFSNSFSLTIPDLSLVYSVLDSSTRFKALSRPSLRVSDSSHASFRAGVNVPVLDSVVVQDGTTQSSYKYIETGLLYDMSVSSYDSDMIRVSITQTLSDYSAADVQGQYFITDNSVSTSLTVKDGSTVLLAGLLIDKQDSSKSSISFLDLFGSRNYSYREIVVLINVKRVENESS